MMKIKYYCDHCDKELDSSTDYIGTVVETSRRFFEVDLCRECLEELDSWVLDFLKK